MNKNFTILIQGKLNYECLDFFVKNYNDTPIVISGWNNDYHIYETIKNKYKNLNNIIPTFSEMPSNFGPANFNLQCISTINGLKFVKTYIVIKIRGDEYYSNLNNLIPKIIEKRKIYCSPIFFRSMKYWGLNYRYHISDHILAGYTKDIYEMFSNAHRNFLNGNFFCETCLTISYLEYKGFTNLENLTEGRKFMIENFDIIKSERTFSKVKILRSAFSDYITNFIKESSNLK